MYGLSAPVIVRNTTQRDDPHEEETDLEDGNQSPHFILASHLSSRCQINNLVNHAEGRLLTGWRRVPVWSVEAVGLTEQRRDKCLYNRPAVVLFDAVACGDGVPAQTVEKTG